MPRRVALERRKVSVPPALARRFLQLDHRRLGRAPKAEQEFWLLIAGGSKALDGQTLPGRREPFRKCGVEALVAFVHRIPLGPRWRHVEQFDFVSAAGHG